MTRAIETHQLTKQYPVPGSWRNLFSRPQLGPPAVDRVDLTVQAGELFGLVGPNGAGKTTLIKMLTTLVLPTAGAARVNSYPLGDEFNIKRSVGLVTSDERSFFWRLTAWQNLEFFAALHGIPDKETSARVSEVLGIVGLEDAAAKQFRAFSTGMRQRLSIARALIPNPQILFLDEPTKGLDPDATRKLHSLVRDQLTREQGMTVLMTSHHLEEVERLCDRIAIMATGGIRACGTIAELQAAMPHQERYRVRTQGFKPDPSAQHPLSWIPDLQVRRPGEDVQVLEFDAADDPDTLRRVIDSLHAHGGRIVEITRTGASLEALFTRVTRESPEPQETVARTPVKDPSWDTTSRQSRRPLARSHPIRDFWRVLGAFLVRDLRSEMSYRVSFFLQFFTVFTSVAVFYFMAQLLGEGAVPYLEPYGGDYFSFLLIGIAFGGYFGVGLSGFSSGLRQAQTTGTLEAMLSTPTSLSTIIISSSLWSYLLTTLRVVVYLLVGSLFLGVDLNTGNYGAALLILVLTVISFGSLGILAASFIMVLKRGNPITWIFGTIANLLGGVYYPVTVMPVWMQALANLLPVTYALRAMRMALLQDAAVADLGTDVLVLLGFSVIFFPLSLAAFRWAVAKARLDGSLTHY